MICEIRRVHDQIYVYSNVNLAPVQALDLVVEGLMLPVFGDLNQLLTKYGITDPTQRSFLELIAQALNSQQALKYARIALSHSPALQPVITAIFEQTQPAFVKTFARSTLEQPQPSASSRLKRFQQPSRSFPRPGTAAYETPLQPQPFGLDPVVSGVQSSIPAFVTHPKPDSAAYQARLRESLYTPPVTVPVLKVKLDPELGRLAVALNYASPLRLWLLAREVAANGRGWISLHDLRGKVQEQRLDLGQRQLRRLVAQGQGVFWNLDRKTDRLYLLSIVKIGASLAREANQINPDLVASNLPGMLRQVYLSLAGSLAQFEAQIYAGWFTVKNAPMIARETLMMLFGRDKRTLRRWEQQLQANSKSPHIQRQQRPTLEVIPVYAQSADLTAIKLRPGNHDLVPVRTYQVWIYQYNQATQRRQWTQEQRVSWSLPNRYRSSHIQEHPHIGQGRSVLRASAYAAGFQPPQVKTIFSKRGIHRNPRRYFEQPKRLRSFARRHGSVPHTRYLWRGVGKRGIHLYEPNEDGQPATWAEERRAPVDLLIWQQQRQLRRDYLSWFYEEQRWAEMGGSEG